MFSPDRYVDAMRFAAVAHLAQQEPGQNLPYLVHVVSVAAEVIAALPVLHGIDIDLAVTSALLHDTVEDTQVTLDEIRARYGDAVASGVAALTKNQTLGAQAMADSLRRITEQPREIAIVKLADRITNMSSPPSYWNKAKRESYRVEAGLIADTLGYASPELEARLRARIAAYAAFCT
ncbi:MAG TPA: HD domain-containing protein [Kofleriaceae bacterium]